MTLIEQLKRDRDNLEVEYSAKRSLLDKIIHRADTDAQLAANPPTAEPPAVEPVTTRAEKIGRPRKVRVSNEAAANAAPKPRKVAGPMRRTGEGTVAAAVREVLPKFNGREYTGLEVGEAIKEKFPDLGAQPQFSTKVAGALFSLRERADIEITRREGNRPFYRNLRLQTDRPAGLFNQIHAEVEAKLKAKRAAEEG